MLTAIKGQVRTPDPSWPDLLASVAAPTLVLAGGPASQVPQQRIAQVAAALPDARLVTIDAGHSIHQAAPEPFVAEVAAFLS